MSSTKNSKGKNGKDKKSKNNVGKTIGKTAGITGKTISGISSNNIWVPIFSAFIGIFIFICIPYAANNLNKPIAAAALNVIPSGVILGYFILDTEFDSYFKSLVFVPAFNVIVNVITYLLFKYAFVSAFWALTINVSCWILLVIGCYFIPSSSIPSFI
jgi:hypothetical protein